MTRTAVEPGSVGTPERREPNPITPVEHEGLTQAKLLADWVSDYESDDLDEDQILVDDGLREFPLNAVKIAATTIRTQAAELERLRGALTEQSISDAVETVLTDGGAEQPYGVIAERVAAILFDEIAAPACKYCGPGVITGLPSNACENCMGTGLSDPARALSDTPPEPTEGANQ